MVDVKDWPEILPPATIYFCNKQSVCAIGNRSLYTLGDGTQKLNFRWKFLSWLNMNGGGKGGGGQLNMNYPMTYHKVEWGYGSESDRVVLSNWKRINGMVIWWV